jgi:glycosyl transferase family 1
MMPAHSQKRILVSWYCDPVYIPPFTLSERQTTVGPKIRPNQPLAMFAGWTPRGRYSLKDALISNGLETVFDAVVVWADASGENVPLELDGFDCPKVLCVGDTHHCPSPLRKVIDYAKQAKYDFVISSHNRHHLHWFAESGFTNVAWLPGIKVRHLPRPFETSRKPSVSFLGNAGEHHPRRLRLLHNLHRAIPLVAARGSRDHAADMSASTLVSFNASLNGDLNLRVFETLSAGGCLLTDRLSAQSGLDLILTEGETFVGYDSVEECLEQARFLLAHPDIALKLARSGNEAFVSSMLPERRAGQLLSWIFDGHLDELFRCPSHPAAEARRAALSDRIRIYEDLQELHRVEESPRVLFLGDVADAYLTDALDLHRLRLSILTPDDETTAVWPKMAGRYDRVGQEQAEKVSWDCVVADDGATAPESIKRQKLLTVPLSR